MQEGESLMQLLHQPPREEKKNNIKESLEIREQVQDVQADVAAVDTVTEDYLQAVHRRHHHRNYPIQKQELKKQLMHGTQYFQITKTLQDVTIVIHPYVVQQTTKVM